MKCKRIEAFANGMLRANVHNLINWAIFLQFFPSYWHCGGMCVCLLFPYGLITAWSNIWLHCLELHIHTHTLTDTQMNTRGLTLYAHICTAIQKMLFPFACCTELKFGERDSYLHTTHIHTRTYRPFIDCILSPKH